ncbi:MAG: YacL family protein [Pararheinheimera sp.]|nr:YacL family protein [Rheinheimera sp.]
MEFDFIYNTEAKRYSLKLSSEQLALQCFLLDEFEPRASAYQSLLEQLQRLNAQSQYQWDGKEYRLTVQASEVVICHFSLLQEQGIEMELDPEQDLELDQSQLYAECGLEDLLHLIQQWQQFLPT